MQEYTPEESRTYEELFNKLLSELRQVKKAPVSFREELREWLSLSLPMIVTIIGAFWYVNQREMNSVVAPVMSELTVIRSDIHRMTERMDNHVRMGAHPVAQEKFNAIDKKLERIEELLDK